MSIKQVIFRFGSVPQVFPPGMDTPGFEVENRTKPPETKAIEGNETTHRPGQGMPMKGDGGL